MRRLVWIAAWALVALWSLFSFAGYAILNVAGDFAAASADFAVPDPELAGLLAWSISALGGLGLFAIVVVWGLVAAVILGLGALVAALMPRPAPQPAPLPRQPTPAPRVPSAPAPSDDPAARARDLVDRFRKRA